MKRFVLAAICAGVVLASMFAQPTRQIARGAERPDIRFRPIDIVIDADHAVAAYELEVVVVSGDATITGVEGGDAPLDEPPYYDPAALERGRIIIAAFSTTDTLPQGQHRVATIHFRESGSEPHYEVRVRVAADADGNRLNATAIARSRAE